MAISGSVGGIFGVGAKRTSAHRLGLGETTTDGQFYARVDGVNIGEGGRCFWPTADEAESAAERFLMKKIDYGG